ncbi:P-loop containing nucleoside triphosphate hydrolase protein [Lactarius quietus]|nr:P-loop containing nucleoside triphosphate hydrolase protein [Lactarius quietus]
MSFLDTFDEDDQTICYWVALICYSVTGSTQVPCKMQLRAVLANQCARDCLVSAGTRSGKTLPIVLSILLDDPDKNLITLTLSPLKQLQVTQESDFNTRYGILTVVINEDMPRDNVWWTYQKHIVCVVIDKAHNIHAAGLSHHGLDTFRPAWGRVDELMVILPWSMCWILLSATFPPHICATIEKKLLHPEYDAIHVTSNRLNTVYAMHEVINSIEDIQNYECFLVCPFSVESQPRVLVFVDKKELVCQIVAHLDSCLPREHQDKGIVRHYHNKISQQYLQLTHNAFTEPTGNCCVLVATSGQSVADICQGVDFPDIKIVCMAGLPGSMVDILQHGGHALRNSDEDALFVVFYEPWVHDISLDEYNEGDSGDPDQPRCQLKPSSKRHECAPFSCLKLVKSATCLCAEFALYLNDTSQLGIIISLNATDHNSFLGCDGGHFKLQDLQPGTLAAASLPASTMEKTKQRVTLVRTDPEKIKSAQDVTTLLDETADWGAKWSAKVFEVITKFDTNYACISEESSTCRKPKQK